MFTTQREPLNLAVSGVLLSLAGIAPLLIDFVISQQLATSMLPFFYQGGRHLIHGVLLIAAFAVLAIGLPGKQRVARKPLLIVALTGFGVGLFAGPFLASAVETLTFGTSLVIVLAALGILAGVVLPRSGVVSGWERWLPTVTILTSVYVLFSSLIPLPIFPRSVPSLILLAVGALLLISGILSRESAESPRPVMSATTN
ncbi:hypothetical protein [Agrococcus casei]|uniref:hypothetical protein n=1 Tax=Agrococcus casei TaxID=343512 RepID=UPI000B3508FF|nr:hypothetical protein [Agrococcus casei]